MTQRPTTGGRFLRDPDSGALTPAGQSEAVAEEASPPHILPLDADTPTTPASPTPARPQKRK